MTKEYVFNIKPNYNIIFHRGNTQIGVLDFNGPEMTFSGDMDESAILFIEVIANSFKARLEQERAVGYREGHMAALAQRTWVGLTDEEIEREWQFLHDEEGNPPDHHDFARAIEAAHGIKENI